LVAGSEVVKRLEPSAGVPYPSGVADEHPNPFAIIGTWDVAIRVGSHRLHFWQKREAKEHECNEKWWSCFELNQWIHVVLPFFFPAALILRITGP
jgi:hypothetical protein